MRSKMHEVVAVSIDILEYLCVWLLNWTCVFNRLKYNLSKFDILSPTIPRYLNKQMQQKEWKSLDNTNSCYGVDYCYGCEVRKSDYWSNFTKNDILN